MKPRNSKERQMVALAGKLPPITGRQRAWAFENVLRKLALYSMRKRTVKCMCCGREAVYDKPFIESYVDVDEYWCPYCDRTMPLRDLRDASADEYRERGFFSVATTYRGHQVIRTYDVNRFNRRGDATVELTIDEVYQTWIMPDGSEIITGRQLHRSPFCMAWDIHKPIDIRQHNASNTGAYAMDDVYDLSLGYLYPDVRVVPILRRNGWRSDMTRFCRMVSVADIFRWLLSVPTAEMLAKTGQTDLFIHMVREQKRELEYLHSVRIANRRQYIVRDAGMWLDMLRMAAELGMDTHNPDVVCPADFSVAHDRILARVTRLHHRQAARRQREEAARHEEQYREQKGAYFGICFGNENVTVAVLTSVHDIADEGAAMHHCVYAAGYYGKPDSLILSARDRQGNRIETVEVSLKTFEVLQSRGRCNSATPMHNEIIQLVKSNMNLIKEASSRICG